MVRKAKRVSGRVKKDKTIRTQERACGGDKGVGVAVWWWCGIRDREGVGSCYSAVICE